MTYEEKRRVKLREPRPYPGPAWLGPGYTSKRITDEVRGCEDALQLGHALTQVGESLRGHILYVKTPSGDRVCGYDVEAETLTDGSVVYNLILRTEQGST